MRWLKDLLRINKVPQLIEGNSYLLERKVDEFIGSSIFYFEAVYSGEHYNKFKFETNAFRDATLVWIDSKWFKDGTYRIKGEVTYESSKG